MTEPLDPHDQAWLNALADRAPAEMGVLEAAEAAAVRQALMRRREAIEADARTPSPIQFERLRQRLVDEGLLASAAKRRWWHMSPLQWLGISAGGSGNQGTATLQRWGIVLVLLVGMVAVYQVNRVGNGASGQDDVLRGGTATVLMVDSPQERMESLVKGLDQAKARYTVTQRSDGRIQFDITADAAVLDYLYSQRIIPTVKDGSVRLVLQKN